ncbi:hypothetical protein DSM16313_27650 [Acinetobacter seohaensis]|nr:hypothetical protein DSM16313_27650 [Acinetobacter seohaensis]
MQQSHIDVRKSEVERLKNQSDNFNSVLIVGENKHVLAFAPSSLNFNFGQDYNSLGLCCTNLAYKVYSVL